ncbi:MAG: hypothetical protein OJF59_001740 [Cytophagales bacterium]|nr:MAG: hypothetical protein OJF59_001740 [Cytophagales bacterium]
MAQKCCTYSVITVVFSLPGHGLTGSNSEWLFLKKKIKKQLYAGNAPTN